MGRQVWFRHTEMKKGSPCAKPRGKRRMETPLPEASWREYNEMAEIAINFSGSNAEFERMLLRGQTPRLYEESKRPQCRAKLHPIEEKFLTHTTSALEEDTVCAICQSGFKDGDSEAKCLMPGNLQRDPDFQVPERHCRCNAAFHPKCLERYLKGKREAKAKCPHCRERFNFHSGLSFKEQGPTLATVLHGCNLYDKKADIQARFGDDLDKIQNMLSENELLFTACMTSIQPPLDFDQMLEFKNALKRLAPSK